MSVQCEKTDLTKNPDVLCYYSVIAETLLLQISLTEICGIFSHTFKRLWITNCTQPVHQTLGSEKSEAFSG